MSRARNLSRFKPASTGLIEAANITSGTITNTQINASAAIAQSKMAALAAANMPAGSIVQFKYGITRNNAENVTWSAGPGNGAQFGSSIANRTYQNARVLTITPKFSNSILMCTGQINWSSGNTGNTGAFGCVITRDDTDMIDCSDYPWYNSGSSGPGSYPMGHTVHGTFVLSSAAEQTIRLKAFGYAETGSGITMRYKGHSLTVAEIKV